MTSTFLLILEKSLHQEKVVSRKGFGENSPLCSDCFLQTLKPKRASYTEHLKILKLVSKKELRFMDDLAYDAVV